jgi:hypothetical protein
VGEQLLVLLRRPGALLQAGLLLAARRSPHLLRPAVQLHQQMQEEARLGKALAG